MYFIPEISDKIERKGCNVKAKKGLDVSGSHRIMHRSFVCRTRRPTLNLRPNILTPNKTPEPCSSAHAKCICKKQGLTDLFNFAAGGWSNIWGNIYSRWVGEYFGQYLQQVEYLEEFLQVGGGIFRGIFSAGGWRTCCRWRPLHNWLQPCDRPSSNHSSVCTVRTPQNQALYTYLQNRTNIYVISVR